MKICSKPSIAVNWFGYEPHTHSIWLEEWQPQNSAYIIHGRHGLVFWIDTTKRNIIGQIAFNSKHMPIRYVFFFKHRSHKPAHVSLSIIFMWQPLFVQVPLVSFKGMPINAPINYKELLLHTDVCKFKNDIGDQTVLSSYYIVWNHS